MTSLEGSSLEGSSLENPVVTDQKALREAEFWKTGGAAPLEQRRAKALKRREVARARNLAAEEAKARWAALPAHLWDAPSRSRTVSRFL